MELKRCSKCGKWKELTEFNRDRRASDGLTVWCRECYHQYYVENRERIKVVNLQWRADNPENAKAASGRWAIENPEEANAANRQRYADNPEAALAVQRQWRLAHPEVCRAIRARRRARKLGAAGVDYWTEDHLAARREYYDGLCYLCGAPWEAMDHLIPLVGAGGTEWPANRRPICTSCNSSKGNKWPYDFVYRRLNRGVEVRCLKSWDRWYAFYWPEEDLEDELN